MSDLITPEEIAFVRSKAITIDMMKIVENQKLVLVTPHELASGYAIAFSIDIMPGYQHIEHLGVGHTNLSPDPADAEHIAKAFLGTYVAFGAFNYDIHHFMHCNPPDCMRRLSVLQKNMRCQNANHRRNR